MENLSEEDKNNCLDDNLETRKEKMAQYIQEMRHFCQQIAQFPSEVKKVIFPAMRSVFLNTSAFMTD